MLQQPISRSLKGQHRKGELHHRVLLIFVLMPGIQDVRHQPCPHRHQRHPRRDRRNGRHDREHLHHHHRLSAQLYMSRQPQREPMQTHRLCTSSLTSLTPPLNPTHAKPIQPGPPQRSQSPRSPTIPTRLPNPRTPLHPLLRPTPTSLQPLRIFHPRKPLEPQTHRRRLPNLLYRVRARGRGNRVLQSRMWKQRP